MRLSLIVPAVFAGSLALANSAQAQNYPWCAQYSGGRGGGGMNCGFVSFEQCMLTVQGMGGFCIVNNRYVPPTQGAKPAHGTHKHYSHKKS